MRFVNKNSEYFFYILIMSISIRSSAAGSWRERSSGSKGSEERSHGKTTLDKARVLILHPIYAGSHELVLRKMGELLEEKEGHEVTQVRWKYHNMRDVNSTVEVITMAVNNENQRYFEILNNFKKDIIIFKDTFKFKR